MSDGELKRFENRKYLSLETFRRDGRGVRTPVWFSLYEGAFYVYSRADAGKVKRIRNIPRVRIAPCDARGGLRGEWVEASARIVRGAEAAFGQDLLREKYGMVKRVGDLISRFLGHEQTVIAISPDN